MRDPVQWASPSPLWATAATANDVVTRRAVLQQPIILRFASDTFMEDFLAMLENDPARLGELIAQPETWRGPLTVSAPPKQAPFFARTLSRLGLVAARQKSGVSSLVAMSSGAALPVALASAVPIPAQPALKLYQSAHQRYYLVAACLVCGRAGLPDRTLNTVQQERVSFVVRRLLPPGSLDIKATLPTFNPNTWEEYAFVAEAKGSGWQRIAKTTLSSGSKLIPGEEQLPVFAVHFSEDDGRKRRLFAGTIPVGRREAYMGALARPQPEDAKPAVPSREPVDPRMMLVWTQVTEPWKRLLEQADATRKMQGIPSSTAPPSKDEELPSNPDPTKDARRVSLKAAREQIQTVSWYVLLDFAKFLQEHVPDVWRVLHGQPPQSALTGTQNTLVSTLTGIGIDASLVTALQNGVQSSVIVKNSLKDALVGVQAAGVEDQLESVTQSYERKNPDPQPQWPTFLFPLADAEKPAPLPPSRPGEANDPTKLADQLKRVDYLTELIEQALPQQILGPVPTRPLAAQPVMDTREGWFVIRCVFERPACGPLDPPLVSEPTSTFQLAGFFDPDAPARPIRIALPVDTSPAGLRKFDKNTAFMISDMLCGQIDRVKGLGLGDLVRSVLPWPLHKDLSVPDPGPCKDPNDLSLQAGIICSFSIPIITICALILLMIIVNLLDIIFRWVPYFFICFPLPGFKAKK